MKLQAGAAELERTVLGLQRAHRRMQERLAIIKAGHDGTGGTPFPVQGDLRRRAAFPPVVRGLA